MGCHGEKKVFFRTFNGNTVVNGINHQCDIQKWRSQGVSLL
jgi:phosphate starvation-inducible protein PhoH